MVKKQISLFFGILIALTVQGFCQNALHFTGINLTPENALQLHWASNTNEVYEIDYANELATNDDGTTAWNKLYDDYPSHGTNTFWLDTGDYNLAPEIPHPKYEPTRFYRIALTGTNNAANPTISITSPTNGAVVSSNLTIVVSASSGQVLTKILLYVDGQEMPPSDDGTNFVINTCEWWNGQHTIFAVAKSQSGIEGSTHDQSITYGRKTSSYVNVTFDNLISEVTFSEPFFEPSIGQTQQVSANFSANCNWTLQIQDANSNTVRNASGSGTFMSFKWDGTGDGETNILDGVYHYLISAQTNGAAFVSMSVGRSLGTLTEDITEVWALPEGSDSPVPLALYPPGTDTNGFTLFEASQSEVRALTELAMPTSERSSVRTSQSFSVTSEDSSSSSSASQSTTAPGRPPNNPVKNAVGTFGICYQQFLNTNLSTKEPVTGWPSPLPVYVAVDGNAASSTINLKFGKNIGNKLVAEGFSQQMQKGAWKAGFIYADDQVSPTDLKKASLGGNNIFNGVNFGFLLTHGSYATTSEDDNVKYTYLWIESLQNANIQYLRLSDFDFGSSGATGLRWMTILACNTLTNTCYNSMHSNSKLPINDNLHLLLGGSTVTYSVSDLGENYARNLVNLEKTIIDSWNQAGSYTYSYQHGTNMGIVKFTVSGWPNCYSDSLKSYEDPDTSSGLQYQQTQVYTP